MLNGNIPEVDSIKIIIEKKKTRNTIAASNQQTQNFDLNMSKKLSMLTNVPSMLDKRYVSETKGRKTRKSNFPSFIGFNIGGLQVSAEKVTEIIKGLPDTEELFYNRESLIKDDTCFNRHIAIRKRSRSPQRCENNSSLSSDMKTNRQTQNRAEALQIHKEMLQEKTALFMKQKSKNLHSILKKNKALIETVPPAIAVQSVKD